MTARIELLKFCRGNKLFANIAVIIVTSEAEQQFIVTALSAGANDYIIKPFSKDVLQETLQRLNLEKAV